jgi:hypothetical protein
MRGGRSCGLVGIALALTLALAACGGDDNDSGGGDRQRGGELRRGIHDGPAEPGRARSRWGPSSTSPCSASRTWKATPRASTSRSPSSSP